MPRVDVTLRGTPPPTVPATVTPASIARTVTIPAPSISTGVRVTPAAVAAVASVPQSIPVAPSRDDLVIGVNEPDQFNTGLLPGWIPTGVGANMTTYSGPSTITANNTTIQNQIINVVLSIRASNVTIRNCYIIGPATTPTSGRALIDCDNVACVNALIIDCELVPQVVNNYVDAIRGHDYTAKRNKVHDVVDAFRVRWPSAQGAPSSNVDVVIEQNLVYDHVWWPDAGQSDGQTHNDGVQIEGGDGTGSRIRGNSFNGRTYSARSHASGPPDRGTGTVDNGRFAQGALCGVQYTNNGSVGSPSGYTAYCTDLDVADNWIRGYFRGINAGSANNTDVGRWYRNKYDDAQGLRSNLNPGTGHTANCDPTTTLDAGEGTANANVYLSGLTGITGGTEVTVRRNQ